MTDDERKYMEDNGWIIERQRQKFITYKGLIWLAHRQGLCYLSIEPIKEDYDKGVFVFRAHAKARLNDTLIEVFEEGDATPKNVSKMILPHIRRMAQTRAKARALRDLTGVGLTAFEEIAD